MNAKAVGAGLALVAVVVIIYTALAGQQLALLSGP